MTRWWDEFAAAVFDVISPPLLLLLLLAVAGVTAALWYSFPAWVPRRMPRWRRPRWRKPRWRLPRFRRGRKITTAPEQATAEPVFEPSVVLGDGTLLADRLAAEGRYAEAVRQRLRDVVGDLAAAGVISPLPGTTAAEVAATAAVQRPAVAAPLGGATELFSEIWYGDLPAERAHDEHMRALTGEVRARMRGGTP
ncbi:DUF4129 domain-containing protein [Actinoplanes sp. NPDC051346]|uniref:DUF4129 domain-containing protein n=1 Tax=Actinoplanes sp. NPDC051346 TaxID=3155048 RepID=UPI003416329B